MREFLCKFVSVAILFLGPQQIAVGQDAAQAAAEQGKPLTVVELFTSQGCSSCPPADAILKTMSSQPDLLTLSWAVDYWDRLGWEDTFGHARHSRRQRTYNKRLGMGGAFTPQMIVDGRVTAVGSRKGEIRDAIDEVKSEPIAMAMPKLVRSGDDVTVTLPAMPMDGKVLVNIVYYTASAVVDVGRGENRGRTLHYTNVVRRAEMVHEWTGEAITLTLNEARNASPDTFDHVAVLLQKDISTGPIVGAAKLRLTGSASGR